MLDIHGTSIFLTRGDTAYLQFPLYNVVYKDGKISEKTKYEIGDGDTLTLTVSKKQTIFLLSYSRTLYLRKIPLRSFQATHEV